MKKSCCNNNLHQSKNYKSLVLHLHKQKTKFELHLLNKQNLINKIYKIKN